MTCTSAMAQYTSAIRCDPGAGLPFTGLHLWTFGAVGLVLVFVGLAVVALTAPRREV